MSDDKRMTIDGIELHFDLGSGALGWCSDWGQVWALAAKGLLRTVSHGPATYGATSFFPTDKGRALAVEQMTNDEKIGRELFSSQYGAVEPGGEAIPSRPATTMELHVKEIAKLEGELAKLDEHFTRGGKGRKIAERMILARLATVRDMVEKSTELETKGGA